MTDMENRNAAQPGRPKGARRIGTGIGRQGYPPTERGAGTNREIRRTHRVVAVDLHAIPTMDLLAELARRERIALCLVIEEALATPGNAQSRPATTGAGDKDSDGETKQAQ
jgi:hypothetical protein